MRTASRLPTVLLAAVAAGCAATEHPGREYFALGDYDAAAAAFDGEAESAPSKDRTLWLLEAGTTHLAAGHAEEALARFREAQDRFRALSGEGQEEALRTSSSEDVKEFKGEPFEQSFCSFYEGWLHFVRGETNLASACFLGSRFYDRSETERSDFALALFFDALTCVDLGETDEADELFDRVAELGAGAFDGLVERARAGDWNTLVLVECGAGPRKIGSGSRQASLAFDQEWSDIVRLRLVHEGEDLPVARLAWTWHQATELGERVMDTINRRKADAKNDRADRNAAGLQRTAESWNEAADRATSDAQLRALRKQGRNALVASGILNLLLDTAQPGADVRTWTTLPDAVHVGLARLPEGERVLHVEPIGRAGVLDGLAPRTTAVSVGPGRTFVHVRLRAVAPADSARP